MDTFQRVLLQLVIVVVITGLIAYLYATYRYPIERALFGEPADLIAIDKVRLQVDIVDEPATRRQGLSGRESLGDFEGMLFVFDTADYHGIWMKDMQFPIDIIWIGNDLRVVHVEHNISPETFPAVYTSPEPARFVLETKAYFADTFGIEIGDRLQLVPEQLPPDLRQRLQNSI